MTDKLEIFRKPTARQITKGKNGIEAVDNLVDALLKLDPETEYLIIDRDLIPERFFYENPETYNRLLTETDPRVIAKLRKERLARTEASRKFMKHGPEIHYPRFSSVDEIVLNTIKKRWTPMDWRGDRFDTASPGFYAAWSYAPIVGTNDKRKRKVPLVEVAKGAKLFDYASRFAPIIVTPYADSERDLELEGGSAIVEVPSRTPKARKYKFEISGFPVADNQMKVVIANSLISNHACSDMLYRIRKTYVNDKESSKVFNWDAHDIAGWYAILYHYLSPKGKRNKIPLENSQIPLPSQLFADIYDRLRYNAVIRTFEREGQKRKSLYPLDNAEMEITMHGAVQKLGHDATLVSKARRDGKLADYQWRNMPATLG